MSSARNFCDFRIFYTAYSNDAIGNKPLVNFDNNKIIKSLSDYIDLNV